MNEDFKIKLLKNSDVIDIELYHTGEGEDYFADDKEEILERIKYFLDIGVPFVSGDVFMTYDGGFWKITDRVFRKNNDNSFGMNITVTLDEI